MLDERRITLDFDQRELDTIIAALRLWEAELLSGEHIPRRFLEIAENGRESCAASLMPIEIDALCERLNC